MKHAKPIIWGVAIIALGVIFGGNALGLFELNIFFDGWWTLFIIIPSVIGLFADKDKFMSLGLLAVGVVLLLAAQDVFSYDVAWKVLLAVLLVLIGISIIVKNIFYNKNSKEIAKKVKQSKNDDDMDSQIAVFSGSERTYDGESFTGANIVAVFGGVDLDLRKAKIEKDVIIKAFCLFGGIDIIVPDDVQVKTQSGFIFGGISDERESNKSKGKYTLYVDAAGGFGGVNIADEKE